jgi:hypothetical protein
MVDQAQQATFQAVVVVREQQAAREPQVQGRLILILEVPLLMQQAVQQQGQPQVQ